MPSIIYKISKSLLAIVSLYLFGLSVSLAGIIVDFSPDTTAAPLGQSGWANNYPSQIIGGQFTLATDTTLTGGSIFSGSTWGFVGNSARFMIFSDLTGTPASSPLFDIVALLDVVDTSFTTTETGLTRKHVSITDTFLAAGSYWFSMPGNGVGIGQASTTNAGGYDDGVFRYGSTNLVNSAALGDMYFQLEGTAASVPEPATLALIGFGLAGIYGQQRRKKVA